MPTRNGFTPQKITALTATVRVRSREQLVKTTEFLVDQNQERIAGNLGTKVPTQQWVDGVLGKPLDEAQKYTATQFQFLSPVVDEAMRLLFEASPVGPAGGGHYRDDHWLFVNGERIDNVANAVKGDTDILPTDIVRIVNRRPYARKIEGGFHSGSRSWTRRRPGLSVQATNGVYEITAIALRSRFGNIASIVYTFSSEGGENDDMGGFPALEITGK